VIVTEFLCAADVAHSITQMPVRERRRVIEGTAAAALLSALPSSLVSLRRHRSLLDATADLLDATRAAGTLIPPGRDGLLAGTAAHFAISAGCGELLARMLPQRRSVIWGAGGGLAIGVVNLVVIGRRFPRIRALPLVPQLADNVAFGIVFALIADR
jgi:hypothetical protein